MRGIKECFICRQDHLARHLHNKENTAGAVEGLKLKYPSALLTVEDLSGKYAIMKVDDYETAGMSSEWVQRADEGRTDYENIALFVSKEGGQIGQCFPLSAFVHGRNTCSGDIGGFLNAT